MLSYKCQVIVVSWTKTTTVSSPIASNVLSADKAQHLLVFSSLIAQVVYLLLNKYGHFILKSQNCCLGFDLFIVVTLMS